MTRNTDREPKTMARKHSTLVYRKKPETVEVKPLPDNQEDMEHVAEWCYELGVSARVIPAGAEHPLRRSSERCGTGVSPDAEMFLAISYGKGEMRADAFDLVVYDSDGRVRVYDYVDFFHGHEGPASVQHGWFDHPYTLVGPLGPSVLGESWEPGSVEVFLNFVLKGNRSPAMLAEWYGRTLDEIMALCSRILDSRGVDHDKEDAFAALREHILVAREAPAVPAESETSENVPLSQLGEIISRAHPGALIAVPDETRAFIRTTSPSNGAPAVVIPDEEISEKRDLSEMIRDSDFSFQWEAGPMPAWLVDPTGDTRPAVAEWRPTKSEIREFADREYLDPEFAENHLLDSTLAEALWDSPLGTVLYLGDPDPRDGDAEAFLFAAVRTEGGANGTGCSASPLRDVVDTENEVHVIGTFDHTKGDW